MKNYILYLIIGFAIFSCKPKVEEQVTSKGTADFTTYVALGNSLTAGYADGALYSSGQVNSYPNMLAHQFAKVGGSAEFKQPLMPDDEGVGISGLTLNSKLQLAPKADCKGLTSLSPTNKPVSGLGLFTPIGNLGPYNNLGIPGAKSFHMISSKLGKNILQGGNPFYTRFALHPGDSTVLSDAMSINPTFFTLWIGSNDVLLYALYGGDKSVDSITAKPMFDNALDTIVSQLTSRGAKGAIANLPDITDIPYFTTIPYNGLVLTDPAQVSGLNAAYAKYGITFSLGQNAFVIQDITGLPRKIKSTEYLVLGLPQDSIKCKGWGSLALIPHTYVLDENEIQKIKNATNDYNNTIAKLASDYKLALVDMNKNLRELNSGIQYNGINFNGQFVSGGAFSLDGVHLNPRGYALVANYYIRAINTTYGAKIPSVDVTQFPGVVFP